LSSGSADTATRVAQISDRRHPRALETNAAIANFLQIEDLLVRATVRLVTCPSGRCARCPS